MRTSPRRLGLLGGITWHSTLEYERQLNEAINAALGGNAAADYVMRSYNFAEIAAAQEQGDWAGLARRFADDAWHLADAGAEAIVICANTMHLVADEVAAGSGLPVIDVRDAVADAALAAGVDTVSLLATGYTMREPFYREHLAARGVTALVPEPDDLAEVHRIIYEELTRGVVLDSSRATMLAVAGRLAERGGRAFVAGCTEIPMIVQPEHVSGPYLDALGEHVKAAVAFALAD